MNSINILLCNYIVHIHFFLNLILKLTHDDYECVTQHHNVVELKVITKIAIYSKTKIGHMLCWDGVTKIQVYKIRSTIKIWVVQGPSWCTITMNTIFICVQIFNLVVYGLFFVQLKRNICITKSI